MLANERCQAKKLNPLVFRFTGRPLGTTCHVGPSRVFKTPRPFFPAINVFPTTTLVSTTIIHSKDGRSNVNNTQINTTSLPHLPPPPPTTNTHHPPPPNPPLRLPHCTTHKHHLNPPALLRPALLRHLLRLGRSPHPPAPNNMQQRHRQNHAQPPLGAAARLSCRCSSTLYLG